MPSSALKTYAFLADAEGLADAGGSANLSVAWSSTDGNPLGSLEWQTASTSLESEKARKSTTDSWETLFGIPTNQQVIYAQCLGFDELNWNNNIANRRIRMRFVDSSNVSILASDLLDTGTGSPANNTGAPVAKSGGGLVAVNTANQPSSSGVKFEIQVDTSSGTGLTMDLEQDNIKLLIVYGNPVLDQIDFTGFPKSFMARGI